MPSPHAIVYENGPLVAPSGSVNLNVTVAPAVHVASTRLTSTGSGGRLQAYAIGVVTAVDARLRLSFAVTVTV